MAKKKEPKWPNKKICAFCGEEINDREGGAAKLPPVVTLGLFEAKPDLHNKCLKPHLDRIEEFKENKFRYEKLTVDGWVSRNFAGAVK